jgi:predicted DNA-binding transcriptional regulator AlpA
MRSRAKTADLLTASAAATLCGVALGTWYSWNRQAYCPAPVAIGGVDGVGGRPGQRWRHSDVTAWIAACLQDRAPRSDTDGQVAPAIRSDRGYTPEEVARLFRVGSDTIRTWIRSGKLGAINTARILCGKPRFVILPEHLAAFERCNRVFVPPKPTRRRRMPKDVVDYFPDD